MPEGRLVPLVGGGRRPLGQSPGSLLYSVSFGSGLPLKDPAPKEQGGAACALVPLLLIFGLLNWITTVLSVYLNFFVPCSRGRFEKVLICTSRYTWVSGILRARSLLASREAIYRSPLRSRSAVSRWPGMPSIQEKVRESCCKFSTGGSASIA